MDLKRILETQNVEKVVEAANVVLDAKISQQAELMGFDPTTWASFVTENREQAEKLYAARVKQLAEERVRSGAHRVDLGIHEIGRLARPISPQQKDLIQMAQSIVPQAKRGAYVALWDPPAADGKVYGYSLIHMKQVQRKILNEGFSIVPRGPLGGLLADPNSGYVCDMQVGFGRTCGKRMLREIDLIRHKQAKHREQWEILQREQQAESAKLEQRRREKELEEQRRERELEMEERRQILAALQKLLEKEHEHDTDDTTVQKAKMYLQRRRQLDEQSENG